MKYCRKCGCNTEEEIKFCRRCGTKLEEDEGDYEDYDDYEEKAPRRRKSPLRIVGITVLTIFLVVAITAGVFHKTILEKYYLYRAENSQGIEKIKYFISAMKYAEDNKLFDTIYLELKNANDFEGELNNLSSSLEAKNYNKLLLKYYLENTESAYLRGEYKEAMDFLNKASNLGYNKNSYQNITKIEKKLKEKPANTYVQGTNNITEITNGDYIIPNSDSRYLTRAELASFSMEKLALARNEIFARHGYNFVQEPYKTYFPSRPWYRKNISFKGDYKELNQYEVANIELIKELEGI
ncbi:MAG: YARHG domain-containing protein [Clostridium sp.]